MKRFLTVLVVIGMIAAFGCSSPTSPTSDKDLEAFFAGVSPIPTGEVGSYKIIFNDGSVETGILIASETGDISMSSERGSSVYENATFKVSVDYLAPQGYTGMGLPYYYLGDTFTYKVDVDYKKWLPLNFDWLHAAFTAEQRYWPGGGLLPGAPTEVWDPLLIPSFGSVELTDTFTIVAGTIPGNDATWCIIDGHFLWGMITWEMAGGICGFWDP